MATLAGGASLDDLWGVVRLTSCHTLEGSHGMQRETWSLRNTLRRMLNGVAFAEGLRAELHCYTTATSVSTTTSTDHCAHVTRHPRWGGRRVLRPAHPRYLTCATAAAQAHCGVARMSAALLSWGDAGPCERLAWAAHSGNTMRLCGTPLCTSTCHISYPFGQHFHHVVDGVSLALHSLHTMGL